VIFRSGDIVDAVSVILEGLRAGFLTAILRGCGKFGEEAHLPRKWTNEGWIRVDKMTRS
jgi:hypothetical protein